MGKQTGGMRHITHADALLGLCLQHTMRCGALPVSVSTPTWRCSSALGATTFRYIVECTPTHTPAAIHTHRVLTAACSNSLATWTSRPKLCTFAAPLPTGRGTERQRVWRAPQYCLSSLLTRVTWHDTHHCVVAACSMTTMCCTTSAASAPAVTPTDLSVRVL